MLLLSAWIFILVPCLSPKACLSEPLLNTTYENDFPPGLSRTKRPFGGGRDFGHP